MLLLTCTTVGLLSQYAAGDDISIVHRLPPSNWLNNSSNSQRFNTTDWYSVPSDWRNSTRDFDPSNITFDSVDIGCDELIIGNLSDLYGDGPSEYVSLLL